MSRFPSLPILAFAVAVTRMLISSAHAQEAKVPPQNPSSPQKVSTTAAALARWDFANDAEGWYPDHSLAPFGVEGGVLRTSVVGPDPYMACSESCFDIAGSDRHYIEIRARTTRGGSAEFFWAVAEKDQPPAFAAGQEVHFEMPGGRGFQTYRVFPLWKGRIARLRFDPPENCGQVQIDYIAISELPEEKVPERPTWNFAEGTRRLAGWRPLGSLVDFDHDGSALVVAAARRPIELMSSAFAVPATEARFFTLRMASRGISFVTFAFQADDEKGPNRIRSATLFAADSEQPRKYLLDTRALPLWKGNITRVQIRLDPAALPPGEKASARLSLAALDAKPAGPPEIEIETFTPARAFLTQGAASEISLVIRNNGADGLRNLSVRIGGSALSREAAEKIARLAPGESKTFVVKARAASAGIRELQAEVSAAGAPTAHQKKAVVISRPLAPPNIIPARPRAEDREAFFWLASRRVSACFAKNPFGIGPVVLSVSKAGPEHGGGTRSWKRLAVISPLGVVEGDGGQTVALFPKNAKLLRLKDGSAVIELSDKIKLGSLEASVTQRYILKPDDDAIEVETRLKAVKPGALVRLQAPTLLAGDGSFGSSARQALFPGLEYMGPGERSSSALDIAPPEHLRFAPHPNRLTMPLIAVESRDSDLVALLWKMPDKAEAGFIPCPLFASPNFLDGQKNHLMGLFLPSVPEFAAENSLRGHRPLSLKAGQSVAIRAVVLLKAKAGVLESLREWTKRWGLPRLPSLPRTLKQTIALSLEGLEKVLYVEGKGWRSVTGWAPGPSQTFALYYLLAEQALGKECPVPQAALKGIERVRPVRDLALSLHAGSVSEALRQARAQAYGLMASQLPQGGWPFSPSEQTAPLGKAGEIEVGTCAANAYRLLQAGMMLRDDRLTKAGLRALDFMRRFEIPRAAQVWEVPVHTPDILASAHAVDAYLAGYQATGERRYLDRAIYWAETGLPFFYWWQRPEQGLEPMLYGAIPVFGATFYTYSWFGRIVQWCGLAYAHSLLHLAQYDRTYDWKRIAEGITRSGIIQQRTEPNYLGLYPDSIGMIDKVISWPAMLSPALILDNVFALMGRDPHPCVKLFSLPAGPSAKTSPASSRKAAAISAAPLHELSLRPGALTAAFSYPAGWSCYLAFVGVSSPREVKADGRLLQMQPQLDTVYGEQSRTTDGGPPGQGWKWEEDLALLTVKVKNHAARTRLQISGISAASPGPSPQGS